MEASFLGTLVEGPCLPGQPGLVEVERRSGKKSEMGIGFHILLQTPITLIAPQYTQLNRARNEKI